MSVEEVSYQKLVAIKEKDGETALDAYRVRLLDPRRGDGSDPGTSSLIVGRQVTAKLAAGFRLPPAEEEA